jgi:hypothetical protein
MEAALIGLAGVLIGALLAEHFRRNNRIEAYSQKIFERRLEIYEELMKRVQAAYSVGCDVLEADELSKEDRLALVSEAILSIAGYVDENALYVDRYVAADCTAVLMGVEDIADITEPDERQTAIQRFRSHYVAAKQNILEESGIQQINDHFKLVSRPRVDSPLISRLKELEKERARAA